MSEPRPEPDQFGAALRAFAAADAFERDAAKLRAELRRLRAAGRGTPSWGRRWHTRSPFPGALSRIAVEAAFLIAAAVFVGVAGVGTVATVVLMAAAWVVVCGVEWLVRWERRDGSALADESPAPEESLLDALRPRRLARRRAGS
jgi:hypothetical protein